MSCLWRVGLGLLLLPALLAGCPGLSLPTGQRACAQADQQQGEGGQTPDQGQTGDQGAGQAADPAAGQAFYEAHGCANCHGADAGGVTGPSLVGEQAGEVFDRLSGATAHPGGTVSGATRQDADNLAAWLGTL